MMVAVAWLLIQAAWLVVGALIALVVGRQSSAAPQLAQPAMNPAVAFVLVLGIILFWPLLFAVAPKNKRNDDGSTR